MKSLANFRRFAWIPNCSSLPLSQCIELHPGVHQCVGMRFNMHFRWNRIFGSFSSSSSFRGKFIGNLNTCWWLNSLQMISGELPHSRLFFRRRVESNPQSLRRKSERWESHKVTLTKLNCGADNSTLNSIWADKLSIGDSWEMCRERRENSAVELLLYDWTSGDESESLYGPDSK